MEKFEIIPFDMDAAGSGYMRGTVKVHGYWSSDVISLYYRRSWSQPTGRTNMWEMQITHSSGGRDAKVVESDMDAEENFGLALVAAAKYARAFEAENAEKVEVAYQKQRAYERDLLAAEKAEKLKLFNEDTPLGYLNAVDLVNGLLGDERRLIKAYLRGSHQLMHVRVRIGRNIRFTLNGDAISKTKLLEFLSIETSKKVTKLVGSV